MFRKITASFLMAAFLATASTPFYAQDKVKKEVKAKTEVKEQKMTDKKEMKCEHMKKEEKKSCCSEGESMKCEKMEKKESEKK